MLRVLLIDDHTVVRAGLRLLLESEDGIEVVDEAGDLADAVFKVRRHKPDLILLDVRLPTATVSRRSGGCVPRRRTAAC